MSTTSISRRGLVAAAPVAIVAASLPAIAGNDDEHLFALGLELATADKLVAVADRRLSEVSAAYDRIAPDRPEVFALPDDDLGLKSRPEMSKGKPTGRLYYGPKEIEAAEIALLVARERDFPLPDSPEARRKVARLQEIVDRHREDRKVRRAAWIATGMEEAERAADAAHDRCRELRSQIAQCPATTMAGVLLKARIAGGCFGDRLDEADAEIAALIEGGDGERMAFSIARDLVRLASQNAMGGTHA